MSTLSPVLAFGAGALTILSPCVLPLVPIVMGSAAQRHKYGPLALATGLVASFTALGLAVAVLGAATGFDGSALRSFGAVILALAGLLLLVPPAQALLTRLATPLANWANQKQAGLERFGLLGQALIGVLLGLVWSPCVGPTLGAATALAAGGKDIGQATLVMFAFALGIAAVLLVLALATRSFLARWRGKLLATGHSGKRVLGGLLLLVGMFILTGFDRIVEAVVVNHSPDWLIQLTTSL